MVAFTCFFEDVGCGHGCFEGHICGHGEPVGLSADAVCAKVFSFALVCHDLSIKHAEGGFDKRGLLLGVLWFFKLC